MPDDTEPAGTSPRTTPRGTSPGMTLRIEVFPDDLDAFVDFYTRVLGFTLVADRRASDYPYASVEHGSVRIGAARAWEQADAAARALPTGVEIVLEVDDLDAEYRRIRASGYPLAEDLQQRSWGLTDFRVYDPAGYYLRITGRT